jgi:hypothetical protein
MKARLPSRALCADDEQTIQPWGVQSVPYVTASHHFGQGELQKMSYCSLERHKEHAKLGKFC